MKSHPFRCVLFDITSGGRENPSHALDREDAAPAARRTELEHLDVAVAVAGVDRAGVDLEDASLRMRKAPAEMVIEVAPCLVRAVLRSAKNHVMSEDVDRAVPSEAQRRDLEAIVLHVDAGREDQDLRRDGVEAEGLHPRRKLVLVGPASSSARPARQARC